MCVCVRVFVCMHVRIQGLSYEVRGPIGNNFSLPRFPVSLHQGPFFYVLDKPRYDYTLARAPIRRGTQLGAIGPTGLRPALYVYMLVLSNENGRSS